MEECIEEEDWRVFKVGYLINVLGRTRWPRDNVTEECIVFKTTKISYRVNAG